MHVVPLALNALPQWISSGLSGSLAQVRGTGCAIAELSQVSDALGQSAAAVQTALAAVKRAREHARQVEQRLGRAGLRRMALTMGEVVTDLGSVGRALLSEQEGLSTVSGMVAGLPSGATAEEVLTVLAPAGRQVADVPDRLHDLTGSVEQIRAAVAATLKGAQPGPLLGKLDGVKRSLSGVAEAVTVAAQRTGEVISYTRMAGAHVATSTSSAVAGPTAPATLPDSQASGPGTNPTVAATPDRWPDITSRREWLDQCPKQKRSSKKAWAAFQREHAGDWEFKLGTDDPADEIWADGATVDPDTVVAIETKYVVRGERSMYEGKAGPAMLDMLLQGFDKEMGRYGAVIRHRGNPVGRLRLVTNTEAAATFLGERARRLLGDDVDLDIQVQPERQVD